MSLRYSPLCDTNPLCYLAYLTGGGGSSLAHLADKNGSSIREFVGVSGIGSGRESDSVRDYLRGSSTHMLPGLCGKERSEIVALADSCIAVRGFGGVSCDVGVEAVGSQGTDAGLAGSDVGGDGRVLVDSFVAGDGVGVEELSGGGVFVPDAVGSVSGGGLVQEKEILRKNKPGKKMRERLARQAARRVRGSDRSDWRKREEESGEKDELRKSLEAKWAAENALASARAKHQLELLEKVDVDQVARVQETKCKKVIEANMVAMEKAHAFLRSTGNVPGEVGFCQTVVSDDGTPGLSSDSGSPVCTISPDSSASMKDFMACQKKLLDAEAQVEKLTGVLEKYGLLKVGEVGVKKAYTVGENGELPESVLNEAFPDGYIGEILSDGKYRPVGMCADTGLPYTEDGSVLDEIERIKEDRAYEGCF